MLQADNSWKVQAALLAPPGHVYDEGRADLAIGSTVKYGSNINSYTIQS